MAIQTACPHCDKPYRAADNMVGRRVRCRGCGGIFTLSTGASATLLPAATITAPPSGVNAAGPTGELDPVTADAFRIPRISSARGVGRPVQTAGPETPFNPLDAPDIAAVDDSDAVFRDAFQDYRPALRQNYIHSFPYAYLIDRWLPPVLAVVALVWLFLQFILDNDSGVVWAVPVRLLVAGAAFLLIVFPLGWLGMSLGCRWGRFARPPNVVRRVLTATLFPYVLLLVIWHLVGSLPGAIPGLPVALLVAAGLAWLMYRPAADESAISVSAAASAFAVAMLAVAGATVGVNEAARAVARQSKPSPDLTSSPIGPGLAWDPPPARIAPAPLALTAGPPAATLRAAEPAVDPVAASRPVASSRPAPGILPPTMPSISPSIRPPGDAAPGDTSDPLDGSRLFGPGSSTRPASSLGDEPQPSAPVAPVTPPPRPTPTSDPATLPTAPVIVETGDPLADRIVAAASPLVAEVSALKEIEPFERAVFPLTPSNHVLLIRPAAKVNADALEIWDLAARKIVAAHMAGRDDTGDLLNGNYAINAAATRIARISTFPTLGVDLISIDGSPAPARVPFTATYGQARIIGFAGENHLLIRWEEERKAGIQVLDLKSSTFGKGINVPINDWLPYNRAMSPDGRFYAVLGQTKIGDGQEQAELAIVDVRSSLLRKIPIVKIGPQWASNPTGVAFSLDGRKLAIVYERGGEAALLWMPVAAKDFELIAIPAGKTAPLPDDLPPATGRLSSLDGGRAWLIGGNAVINANTEKLIGELGVPQMLGQRPIGGSLAIVRDAEGPKRLILLRLATSLAADVPASGATTRPGK